MATLQNEDNGTPARVPLRPETKYSDSIRKQQLIEGLVLVAGLLLALGLTAFVCQQQSGKLKYVALAGLAGTIGGLLHSLKWFYRTIGQGKWLQDKVWWRFLNPIVSGVLALSIYVIFRAGTFAATTVATVRVDKEGYYAYGIGFLTGLFADNAMSKLRDIAYTLFGPTKLPPQDEKTGEQEGTVTRET